MRAFCKTRSDFHIEKTASSMRDFTWFISVSCFGESKVTVKTWLDKFREVRNILFLAGGWTSWVYRLVDNVTVSSWPFNGQKIGIRISEYQNTFIKSFWHISLILKLVIHENRVLITKMWVSLLLLTLLRQEMRHLKSNSFNIYRENQFRENANLSTSFQFKFFLWIFFFFFKKKFPVTFLTLLWKHNQYTLFLWFPQTDPDKRASLCTFNQPKCFRIVSLTFSVLPKSIRLH